MMLIVPSLRRASVPGGVRPSEIMTQLPPSVDGGRGAEDAQTAAAAAVSSGSSGGALASAPAAVEITPALRQALSARSAEIRWRPSMPPAAGAFSPPGVGAHRPIWFCQQVRLSMEGGAYVAPTLYVPQAVWMQLDTKVPAAELKAHVLGAAVEGLDRVLASNYRTDAAAAVRELADYVTVLDEARAALSKALPFVPAGSLAGAKGLFAGLGSRARQMAAGGRADAVYIEFLAEFLSRLVPLEAMMVYFESRSASGPPMDSFARVADFLQTALLPLVMRDLVHLLDLFIGRVGDLLESGRA
jgi:hypothetical protein